MITIIMVIRLPLIEHLLCAKHCPRHSVYTPFTFKIAFGGNDQDSFAEKGIGDRDK